MKILYFFYIYIWRTFLPSWIRIRIQHADMRIRIYNPMTMTGLTLFSSMAGTSSNMNWSEIPGRKGTNGQITSEIIIPIATLFIRIARYVHGDLSYSMTYITEDCPNSWTSARLQVFLFLGSPQDEKGNGPAITFLLDIRHTDRKYRYHAHLTRSKVWERLIPETHRNRYTIVLSLANNNEYRELFLVQMTRKLAVGGIQTSVPDPWHFGVDPDPDPRIHASD